MSKFAHSLRLLLLVALFALSGCSSKSYAYIKLNNQYVRVELSPEWKPGQSSGLVTCYFHPKYGTLKFTVVRPEDFQEQLARQSRPGVEAGEQNFGRKISAIAGLLEPVKSDPAVAEALKCMAKIPKNVKAKDTRQAWEDWNEAQKSLIQAANVPGSASLLVRAIGTVKLPIDKAPQPIQDLQVGVKALRIDRQYFVLWMRNLICIETFGSVKEPFEVYTILKTFEVNCPPPRRGSGDFTPVGLYLLFIAGPSFFGARNGYNNSSEEPRKGAASGAFRWTVCGSLLGTLVVAGTFLVTGSNISSGQGAMKLLNAGLAFLCFVIAGVVLIGGVIASGLLAALASIGARQGARLGAAVAGISAVLLPLLVVAAILLVQWAKSMSGV